MKLLLCGKSWVACWCLEHLLAARNSLPNSITPICAANESDRGIDTWEPSFKALSAKLGIEQVSKIGDAHLGPGDVLVSLEYDRIIKLPSLGGARGYNIHFSLLPAYRGCITSVWPIRNRETRSGVTLHVLTPGIDDGPIVEQVAFELDPELTAYDLYLEYCRQAFALFRRMLPALVTEKHEALAQDESAATYYSRRSVDFKQKHLTQFDRRAADVAGWVRSLIFPPYQLPEYEGRPIERVEIAPVPPAAVPYPGTVLASDATSALVMCGDFPVRLFFKS